MPRMIKAPGRRMKRLTKRDHIRGLFIAGCSLRGVLADRCISKVKVARACDLPPQYAGKAINHPATPAASRLGRANLLAIYAAAAKLLGVPPGWLPEYAAMTRAALSPK